MLRWVHLLPVRSRLVRLLPFGGGHLLLWRSGSRLADARGGGCSQLSLCPAASTTPALANKFSIVGAGSVSIGLSGGIPGGG